jgi:hypothetical protein
MSKFHGAKAGYEAGKQFLKKVFGKKSKVSPTIKSVKPNLKKTVDQSKLDEYRKRYTSLDKSEAKVKKGKEMMREGQKERKKLVDTGRAFQFRSGTSYHAVDPRESKKYADNMKKPKPQKRFSTGKELEQQDYFNKGKGREKKMGGGMMGRRMGYSQGSSKGKIPTTPKEKSLAKLAPPRDRITFGDVIAGRTKGAKNGKTMS